MEEERTYYKEGLLTEEQATRMCREAKEQHKEMDEEAVDKSIKLFLDAFGEDCSL